MFAHHNNKKNTFSTEKTDTRFTFYYFEIFFFFLQSFPSIFARACKSSCNRTPGWLTIEKPRFFHQSRANQHLKVKRKEKKL